MRFPGFAIAAVFALATIAALAWINRPEPEPAWPTRVQGFCFSPYQADQDALEDQFPTQDDITSDLAMLQGRTNAVRTYSTRGSLADVPALAARKGINVTVGAWIDADDDKNAIEIEGAIRLANVHSNVVRVIVGNEVVLRGDLPMSELLAHLDRARELIRQPVSTAEPWHVWIKHPELAEHVDFLAVHLLPYWEGVEVERAVDESFTHLAELRARFPKKPVVITEIGWPSEGRTRDRAVASEANQALFLRRFLSRAEAAGVVYYVMEAFDQPWKQTSEGAVGAYWGVWDAYREPKFPFAEPIVRTPGWQFLAAVSVGLALALLALVYVHSRALGHRGRAFYAAIAFVVVTTAVWIVYDYSQQYLTPLTVAVGVLLFTGMAGIIAVVLAEAHEWAEAHWSSARHRLGVGSGEGSAESSLPKVSIHVPAYNEPPEMLIETLNALAKLDYPDFEVLVIDNNTPDESTWRPVEAHCATLGEHFRFFHVAPLTGFKAGALNFALARAAIDAEIIAVIDADYVVQPNWLAALVPGFSRPQVAIVQAPQDYRDDGQSAFKSMCHSEYRGFFRLGMITRNERNAIIQHGTMTMVRRTVLDELGWDESSITEDAELGLRVFEAGHEAVYVPESYGKGLMPDTFSDFRKQRFRWAYGAVQILKSHARELFSPGATRLSSGQRYHFVAGWLPWLADGFNLIGNVLALCWSLAMVLWPSQVDAPLLVFSLLPLSLFTFKIVKLVHLYLLRVGAGKRQTFAAAIAGLALAHTIGLAVLKGIFTRNEPFFRTPKHADRMTLSAALANVRGEGLMLVALCAAGAGVLAVTVTSSPDLDAFAIALFTQALPYLAAVTLSVVSASSFPAAWVGRGYRDLAEPKFAVATPGG